MGTVTVESAADEVEGKETEEVLTPSTDEQEPSSETAEAEVETEEAPEPEKAKEETLEQKIDRITNSKADKRNAPLQQNNEKLKAEVATLTAQLNEKTWDRNTQDLFDEESESKGEDVALKRKADRDKVKALVLEYHKNSAAVEKLKPELEAKEATLQVAERTQYVRDKFWHLFFPEEKKDLTLYNAAIKKCDRAEDKAEVDEIFEIVREGLRAKSEKYVPDSGIQGGGGQVDLSKLSSEDRVTRALEKMDKKVK